MNASASNTPTGRFWPHALALLAAALTWPLLMVGGTVTVYRVGMAVYDWPTTFGVNMFVYNMFEASWGVFAEHAHRLYASVVGLSCILLACWYTVGRLGWRGIFVMIGVPVAAALGIVAPTGWKPGGMSPMFIALGAIGPYALALAGWFGLAKRDTRLGLAWLTLALVVAQGFLGGYRVTLNSTSLAFVHGCLGQACFALLVVLVVLTGRKWNTPVEKSLDSANLRRRSATTLAMVYAQIVAGAWVRHFGSEIAVGMHMLLGLAILGHVIGLTLRTERGPEAVKPMRPRCGPWPSSWSPRSCSAWSPTSCFVRSTASPARSIRCRPWSGSATRGSGLSSWRRPSCSRFEPFAGWRRPAWSKQRVRNLMSRLNREIWSQSDECEPRVGPDNRP